MEPKYKPGDILLLRSEDECEALYRNPSLKRPLSLTLEKMVGKYEDGEREKIFNHIVEKIMKSRRNGTFPYGDSKSHVVRVTGIKKPSEMSGYEEIDGFYYTGTTVCIDFFPKNRECTEEVERIFFG